MGNDLTMLILSCNSFSDLWDGHIKLLEKNWPDRGFETFIVTDSMTEKTYPGIGIISAGEGVEWTDRLLFALSRVVSDYVFITLDDYFLIRRVSNQSITDLVEMMKKEKLDYVRLFPRPKKATREQLADYKRIKRIDITSHYSVNLYSGIWRKDFLESVIGEPQNAWQFEVVLHKRAEEYGAKCAVSLRDEFHILDVVRKGKLLHKSAGYFKRHPGIYEGNREVNTWKYEIKLTIQQQAARHLPKRIRAKVKSIMKKRGYRFYSDAIEQEA